MMSMVYQGYIHYGKSWIQVYYTPNVKVVKSKEKRDDVEDR